MKNSVSQWLDSDKYNRFVEILFLIFIAECTLGNSGRWLEIGPLSIRIILFALCFAASLPAVIRNFKALTRNLQVITAVIFGVYLLVCTIIGIRTGNQTGFIWADLTSFMALALVPGFMSVMCSKEPIERAMNVIFWAATVLAIITTVLHFVVAFASNETVVYINDWINASSLGGLALLQTGLQRIYFRSQIFLQVAIVYGVWMIEKTSGKKRFALYLSEGVLLFACILSYTRGFWLGLAASAAMLLLLGVKHWKNFLKTVGMMLAVFAVLFAASWACYRGPVVAIEIVNRFDPDLIAYEPPAGLEPSEPDVDDEPDSIVDEANQAAVQLRSKTLVLLKERIRSHPILGNGLGENLDEIRNDGKTEYMYLDLMMKTGVVGMILFVLAFFGFVAVQIYISISRRRKGELDMTWDGADVRNRVLTAAYLGVAVTSFFNPFLLNPMGITLLMLTSTAVFGDWTRKCEV